MMFSKVKLRLQNFIFRDAASFSISVFVVFFLSTIFFYQREYRIANHRQILVCMGILKSYRPYFGWSVESVYHRYVHEVWVEESTGRLFWNYKERCFPVYVVGKSVFDVKHYAFPFEFPGTMGPIQGVMAIKGDGTSVTGLRIFSQYEDGLGARCGHVWFSSQFKGKHIADLNGNFVGLSVVTGKLQSKVPVSDFSRTVHGISGALMTNMYIEQGLAETLQRYEAFGKRLRRNR